jgi:hypothetical protein
MSMEEMRVQRERQVEEEGVGDGRTGMDHVSGV